MFDINNKDKIDLRTTKLFKGLNSDECNKICFETNPRLKIFEKRELIVHQGDKATHIGILINGRIISVKYHIDGRSQIIRVFSSGDIVGLEAVFSTMVTSPVTLIADEHCSLLFFPYKKIISNESLPFSIQKKILQNILHQMADENIKLMYRNDVLSKRKLRDRILTHLSIISEKKNSTSFSIGMNQEQFAQYLCVDRSALSNELNLMRKDGLISYKRDYYTINKKIIE